MFTAVTKASAVATIGLPSSKRVCSVWVFTLMHDVFTAVATIGLPSSKGVCGVWVFTLMHDVFTAVATIALPSSNGYVVFGCLPGCVYSSCYNCATQF